MKVGVAGCDIAPPEPALLTPTGIGHIQPTRGVLDDMSARAIAFQAGGKVAFVVIGDQLFTGGTYRRPSAKRWPKRSAAIR